MALFTKETPPPKNQAGKIEPAGPGIAFLGPNIVFDGNLTGNEDFLIEGKVKGKITLESDLRIGLNARVEAAVHARNVTIEGTLIGDVSADNRVELINGSNVEGNIKAPKIVVSEGARFRGTVDMGNEKPEEEPRKGKTKEEG
jgi:cytoskeletal protein CcmA (bactofilin family)